MIFPHILWLFSWKFSTCYTMTFFHENFRHAILWLFSWKFSTCYTMTFFHENVRHATLWLFFREMILYTIPFFITFDNFFWHFFHEILINYTMTFSQRNSTYTINDINDTSPTKVCYGFLLHLPQNTVCSSESHR